MIEGGQDRAIDDDVPVLDPGHETGKLPAESARSEIEKTEAKSKKSPKKRV